MRGPLHLLAWEPGNFTSLEVGNALHGRGGASAFRGLTAASTGQQQKDEPQPAADPNGR